MPSHVRFQTIVCAVALSLSALCASSLAQARDDFDTEAADPMKLFNRGQDAHQKGDFQSALDSYEEALKLRPEFPEAEFQKGSALVSLNRATEAERAFRRAVELRKDWAMPHVGLASIFVRAGRDRDAEISLR
nr:tetratricopeptide repeat protein [Pyrinomonadaceae bacterium]